MKKFTNLTTPSRFAGHPFKKLKGNLSPFLTVRQAHCIAVLWSYGLMVFFLFYLPHLNAQEAQTMKIYKDGEMKYCVELSEKGSIVFASTEGVVINGLIWATCNVNTPGTFAAKPEDVGMFYQWNNKLGWSGSGALINNEGGTTWTPSASTENSWKSENDPCPSGWRVPTRNEIDNLLTCSDTWTTNYNGVTGRFFKYGDNELFIPAAGFRNDSDGALGGTNYFGFYWSSTSVSSGSALCLNLGKATEEASVLNYGGNYGFSVRCVSDLFTPKKTKEIKVIKYIHNGKVEKVIPIPEIDSIKFFNQYENVEEGINVNGVIWATRNVDLPGTFTVRAEHAGKFYQWNRLTAWSCTNPLTSNDGSKWDATNAPGDTWDTSPCPAGWRMPTMQEQMDIVKTVNFWGDKNGIQGRFFANGALFFPAAGLRYGSSQGQLFENGSMGLYWSGSGFGSNTAHELIFSKGGANSFNTSRRDGQSVRCVKVK